MADLATVDDVEAAWRSLTDSETTRATYLLGRVSRRIRRRWADVDDRITSGDLAEADVIDVVVDMVIAVMGGPPVRGARSWQVTSGSESRAVTLGSDAVDAMEFESWMVEVFEGRGAHPGPVGCFPPALAWPDGARG